MMKISNWDRWHQEKNTVFDTIDRFSQACRLGSTPSYAYEAGWWSSTVKRLLMEVPRAQRQREIQYLDKQIREMEATAIMQKLTSGE